ncbi:MAG: redoxin domain-containing protein [Promethearchaeota archaeon]|nr:MAG: redoxin domain-containing protein [Candidatus Lokiarchaeota archaeon]
MHCKRHLTYLTENLSKLKELNIKLIAIAIDLPDKLIKMKYKNNFKIQFITDRAGRFSKAYNVFLDRKSAGHDELQISHAIPSKFLINKGGHVVWQYIGTKEDRPSIELIVEAINKFL